jgi:hypothetical protein
MLGKVDVVRTNGVYCVKAGWANSLRQLYLALNSDIGVKLKDLRCKSRLNLGVEELRL